MGESFDEETTAGAAASSSSFSSSFSSSSFRFRNMGRRLAGSRPRVTRSFARIKTALLNRGVHVMMYTVGRTFVARDAPLKKQCRVKRRRLNFGGVSRRRRPLASGGDVRQRPHEALPHALRRPRRGRFYTTHTPCHVKPPLYMIHCIYTYIIYIYIFFFIYRYVIGTRHYFKPLTTKLKSQTIFGPHTFNQGGVHTHTPPPPNQKKYAPSARLLYAVHKPIKSRHVFPSVKSLKLVAKTCVSRVNRRPRCYIRRSEWRERRP